MKLLIILAVISLAFAASKETKDWDELEDLLENPDEFDTVAKEAKPAKEEKATEEKEVLVNPCAEHHCGWGKECLITKKGKPYCECVKECPTPEDEDPFDKVCSNQNETFATLCHLYQAKCHCKRDEADCAKPVHAKTHLEYLGECKALEECTEEHLAQFPERMADWLFQVMKEMKKRQELEGDNWLTMLKEAEDDDEYKHVYPVLWKFCDLDKKADGKVTQHELIPITAPVIPMESCIRPFLEKCDTDDDGQITLKEWGKCLGLKEGEIQERC